MQATELDVRSMARLFKALGDETRLRIVALLAHGELCVCHVEEALDLSQPAASRHLSVLRAANVVEPRRDGAWVYYGLVRQSDPDADKQLQYIIKTFGKREQLQRDVQKLVKIRGPGACR